MISDPTTDQAAAALDIRVGQFDDPSDRQGLAHFCEHMLFLGNEKYPEADDFGSYLSSHGGNSNAFTGLEDTNYFFSIQKDHLEGALDRFSQFFISPRFDSRFVEREINAVNSEHQKNLKDDGRRIYQVLRSISNPKHPFSKFGTGNLQTLRGENADTKRLRGELIEFFNAHYSADRMKVVILGKESLGELEMLARTYFSAVKNTKSSSISFSRIPVVSDSLPRKILVQPVRSMRKLRLMFPIPSQREFYQYKSAGLIAHLLGDESTGSVLARLRKLGWATSLSAGIGPESSAFAFLGVNITLTPEGLQHVDETTEMVFQYLHLIKREKDLKRYFDELKKISEIEFQFHEKENPYGYVSKLAINLQDVPTRHVIVSGWLFREYKSDMVGDLLTYLTPDNLQMVLVNNDVSADRTDKWYKTRYGVERIPVRTISTWEHPSVNPNLHLPAPNPFIPDGISLKPLRKKELFPILLKKADGIRIWHKQDDRFKVPKGNLRIRLAAPLAYSTVEKAAMTNLFTLLLQENLSEYAYPALIAGLNYSVSNSVQGIELSLSGYSENLPLLFNKIIDTIVDFKVDRGQFEIFRNQIKENRQNQKLSQAYRRVGYEMHYLLSETLWHTDDYLGVIDGISVADLEEFIPDLLAQTHI
ncbi:MAG: hypothetical protein GY866_30195, partial [Proteobacteria bacterium]|nr:hypothetical protein [Pseudomonadota bacterium]